jgi:hypothetical protein
MESAARCGGMAANRIGQALLRDGQLTTDRRVLIVDASPPRSARGLVLAWVSPPPIVATLHSQFAQQVTLSPWQVQISAPVTAGPDDVVSSVVEAAAAHR